jgi:KaiC/GvpD/RAD55 family RecA-like ATPase
LNNNGGISIRARKTVPTGIYGLDDLIEGGFRKNTVNVICGGPGVGKTTFAIQYLLHGINHGCKGIFVSFEMPEKQIIQYCVDLGLYEVEEYIEQGNLKILHFFGEDLVFPPLDMVQFIKDEADEEEELRIAIDPLTYFTIFLNESERKFLSLIFQGLRELGTSVIALEEYKSTSPSVLLPLYLADTVIHMQNLGLGELYNRTIKITKTRGSKHGEGLYPYTIENGLGIVVEATEVQKQKILPKTEFENLFDNTIRKLEQMNTPVAERVSKKLEVLKHNWVRSEAPEDVLDLVLRTELGEQL